MISVVLFDLDDTLFAHRRAVEDGVVAHLRTLTDLPRGFSEQGEAERWTALEERHYTRYLGGELDYLGQRHARARDFMEPYGITFADDLAAETWFEDYLRQYRAAWTLHDDALPALEALAGLRLGIITNGVAHFQQPKLDVLGLTPFFDEVVMSAEFGAAKPDPSIFLHACALFGVPPSAAAYVGDRLNTDAIGAARAGLTGIWLDRDGTATPAQLSEADDDGIRVIHSLDELAPLLSADRGD